MPNYSFLKKLSPFADREAAEGAEDVARMMGKSGEDELARAQRLAQEAELAATFSGPKSDINQQIIIDPLTGKSAKESAETLGLGNELDTLGERGLVPRSEQPMVIIPKDVPAVGEESLKVGKLTNDAPVMDAEIIPPGSESATPENLTRMEKALAMLKANKGKAAVGAGALGLGAASMMGGSNNPPPAPPSAPPAPPVAAAPLAPKLPVNDSPIDQPSETDKALLKYKAMLSRPSAEELAPANPANKVIDFGQDQNIANMEGLKDAQKRSNLAVLGNQLGRAGEIFNVGAANSKSTAGLDAYNANIKDAEKIPEQYMEQVKFQKNDPNSAVSKGYRQLAKSMGFDIQGAASAADIEKQLPQLSNIYNQEQASKARISAAKESRQGRLAELQLKMAMMKDQKEDIALEKDRQKLGDLTNFSKQARGNAAQIENMVNQGERLQTLIDAVPKNRMGEPNLSRVTPLQKEELIRTFDTLLAGKSTVSGQQELMKSANSVYNDAAKLKQYLTGNKAYGNEAGMLKSIVDTVNREKGLAIEKIKDMSYQNSVGFKRLNEKDPAYVKQILKEKALMDDTDVALRQAGFRAQDINRLLNEGYDKDELLKLAQEGQTPHKIKGKNLGQAHKGVPGNSQAQGAPSAPPPPPAAGMVKVKLPNGKVGRIPEDKLQDALSRGAVQVE